MSRGPVVTRIDDRWIIHARGDKVREVAVASDSLRIVLDSDLHLEVNGSWRATHGPPRTGSVLDVDEVRSRAGGDIRSLVLFSTGSIRLMLSTGLAVVAKMDDSTSVFVELPGEFNWHARAGSVQSWAAE